MSMRAERRDRGDWRMSAPDPKAWEEPDDDPEILAFAYRIARRRALAELKAFLGDTCIHCTDGMTYSGGIHPLADGSGGFICTDFRLRDRIAAIEAEEA